MVIPRLGTDSGRPSQSFPEAEPVLFDPSLNTLLAWYDAGNASGIHHTANAVDMLDDLSGNGRHISNISAGRPAYDAANGKIAFNGTSNVLYNTSPFLWSRSEKAVYAVINAAVAATGYILAERSSTTGAHYSFLGTGNNSPNDANLCPRVRRDVNTEVLVNIPMMMVITGEKMIVRLHEKNGLLLGWANGTTSLESRSYERIEGDLTLDRFSLGGGIATSAGNFIAMDFYELIVMEDDSLGEQIEGYLAHRHGLASSLPDGHRYKTAAPLQGDVTDYSIKPAAGPINAVLFGDSLTSQNTTVSGGTIRFNTGANFTWYHQLSNGRCYLQLIPTNHNKGSSGNTLSQMKLRLGDLDALTFDVCFLMGGTNSLTSVSYTTMRSQLDEIISYITLKLGKRIVVSYITPKDTDSTGIAAIDNANWHIARRHGSCMGRVIAVDTNSVMNDGTGMPVANALYDNVHFTPYGGYLVGTALDAALEPYFGRGAMPDFSGGNLLANGVLAGTGGSGAGQVAMDWTYATSGPASTASKDGSDAQLVQSDYVSTSAGGNTWELSQTITDGYANGDKIYAAAMVRTANFANIGSLCLEINLAPSSAQTYYNSIGNRSSNGYPPENVTDIGSDYLIVTPVLPLSSDGITSIETRLFLENQLDATQTSADVTIKGIGLFKYEG
ncbi:MAG TPA: SGNH/GDSL hydrolase family protein [Micavibrio sp.]|nr:SGNH/GDSL hydrolase family protein [Micavibrio sp.]